MTTKDALLAYLVEQHLRDEGDTSEAWFRDNWYRLNVGGHKLPVFPLLFGLKRSLLLHDVHHLISGYDISWRGELALAGWELGSGGCGWHLFFWFDRVIFFLLALLLMPASTLKALRRGLKSHNLYRLNPEEVLTKEIEELRQYVTA